MVVKIRFARFGRKDRAFYRMVAINSEKSREGQPLEYVSLSAWLQKDAGNGWRALLPRSVGPHCDLWLRASAQLGTYDPIAMQKDGVKEVRLRIDRIKYWLSVGAQPSEPAALLLSRVGLLPAPPIHYRTISAIPKADRKKFSTLAGGAALRGSGMITPGTGLFAATLGRPSATLSPAFLRVVV